MKFETYTQYEIQHNIPVDIGGTVIKFKSPKKKPFITLRPENGLGVLSEVSEEGFKVAIYSVEGRSIRGALLAWEVNGL